MHILGLLVISSQCLKNPQRPLKIYFFFQKDLCAQCFPIYVYVFICLYAYVYMCIYVYISYICRNICTQTYSLWML